MRGLINNSAVAFAKGNIDYPVYNCTNGIECAAASSAVYLPKILAPLQIYLETVIALFVT